MESFVATHVRLVTGAVYAMSGNKLDTPSYEDFMQTEGGNDDCRSAEEIKRDIVRKLVS